MKGHRFFELGAAHPLGQCRIPYRIWGPDRARSDRRPMTIALGQLASRHDPIGPVIRGTYRPALPFERRKEWHGHGLRLPPSQVGSYPPEANLLLQFVDCC